MTIVKLTAIGDSTGVILPAEILSKMGIKAGDELSLHFTANGVDCHA